MFNKVRNKLESQRLIEKKGLNYNPYLTLRPETTFQEIHEFSRRYDFLAIRDPRPMGTFIHSVPRDKLISTIAQYPDRSGLRIQPSLKAYDDKYLVLQGDIEIRRFDFTAKATLNDKPGVSLREATNNPELLKTYQWDWGYDRDPDVPGLKQVIDYIFRHELFDMIVEFTLYSKPVGIKREELIIWECRNY